jgi:hypothetical protein
MDTCVGWLLMTYVSLLLFIIMEVFHTARLIKHDKCKDMWSSEPILIGMSQQQGNKSKYSITDNENNSDKTPYQQNKFSSKNLVSI